MLPCPYNCGEDHNETAVRNGFCLNSARSYVLPHLLQVIKLKEKVVVHLCEKCGAERIAHYRENSWELEPAAVAYSFIDFHKHDDWPEVIDAT